LRDKNKTLKHMHKKKRQWCHIADNASSSEEIANMKVSGYNRVRLCAENAVQMEREWICEDNHLYV